MKQQTFSHVWYRPGAPDGRSSDPSEATDFQRRRGAYDTGRMAVPDKQLAFIGQKEYVEINRIDRIDVALQGGLHEDWTTEWVRVRFFDGTPSRNAYFADGRWRGLREACWAARQNWSKRWSRW